MIAAGALTVSAPRRAEFLCLCGGFSVILARLSLDHNEAFRGVEQHRTENSIGRRRMGRCPWQQSGVPPATLGSPIAAGKGAC